MNRRTVIGFIAAVLMVGASPAIMGQAYPSRPIRIIVPWPPGGGNDVLGRVVAAKLAERMGQQVVVENKAGAAGNIGAEQAARSEPDGYTILLVQVAVVMNPALQKNVPFDVQKDLVPLGVVGTLPIALVVNPSMPARNVAELIAYAKANPGKLSYGSAGIGSPQHLAMEVFLSMTGTQMLHVPYKGAAPLTPAVISNEVQVSFNGLSVVLPHVRSGKMRALAVAGAERAGVLPEVPTIAETVPGYEVSQWYGFMVPRGVPESINATLAEEIRVIVTLPDVRTRLEGVGFAIRTQTPAQMGQLISDELVKWAKVVKDSGIKTE